MTTPCTNCLYDFNGHPVRDLSTNYFYAQNGVICCGGTEDACDVVNITDCDPGSGETLVCTPSKIDCVLQLKTLSAGANVTLTPAAGTIEIAAVDTTVSSFAFNGIISNASGSTENWSQWGTNANAAFSPALRVPFASTIVGFTVNYIHDNQAITVPAGPPDSSMTFEVGTLTGSPPVTFTAFGSATIVWTPAVTGTYPSNQVTGSLGNVPAGTRIGVRSTEDNSAGGVTPTAADVSICVFFERT